MTAEAPWIIDKQTWEKSLADWTAEVTAVDAEVFQRPWCAGYWLYGVEWDIDRGWLAYEFDESTFDPNTHNFNKALAAWRAGRELPKGYFRLDKAFARRAFEFGCRRWGWAWHERHGVDLDGGDIDCLIQWTLLGEIRYG